MQRSSESIAKLASALAKAQIELVNPEKTLVGIVYPEGASREGRSFNYASLASGLEIVRKTLGSTRSLPCRRPLSTRLLISSS